MEPGSGIAGGGTALHGFRTLSIRAQSLSVVARYAIAVAVVAIALLVRVTLDSVWQTRLPYITLFPAIMISAWAGGLGPGLLTTALAAIGAAYFWMAPLGSPTISDPSDWLGLAMFVSVGAVVAALNESWRRDALALAESEQRLAATIAAIGVERRRLEADREARDQIARELAAIVETSDDAIVSKDLESTIRSWNRGAERIFGYTAEEMVGRSIRTIIPVDRWSEEDEVLRQLRQGNRVDHFETIRRRKDGTEVPVSLTISPLYSAAGVVVGASKIARDITERRQAEAERARLLEREQQARADIERAGRLKDDFLAVLSHELRTPLNAVVGYTQLLLMGSLPPDEIQHAYHAIQRNAQAQVRLVESLLDLSRILAGKLEVNAEAVELSAVVALAVDALRPEAIRKGVELEIADADTLRVVGDGPKLQQVFWNLLSNAIRYTPAGGRVRVELSRDGADATVRVIDNGRGIAASLLPVVFDRFMQGEGENARYRGGLGLGLALVRELVHAHKGTVTAFSAGEGHGATFTVRLPLLQAVPVGAGEVVRMGRQDGPDLRELRPEILIVDDERDAREMLALVLDSRGARTRTAATASAAFDAMVERAPEVLLADVGMAGEDGYGLIRRWRTHEHEERREPIAAIAVTAYATSRDREEALAAGFDWHIAKPVDADELVRVITAMRRPRRTVS